ncbi:hypothetical protein NDA18_001791 [Ustilago nuda]|nr:hypothetical protein NDA18_001791 [Ustilago nuda]
MKLFPTFSVLLIAAQMIAAVQLDQLQQPRFVKVRRNLSNDAGSSETQRSVERRNAPEFGRKFEGLGSQSKKVSDLGHLADSQGKIDERYNVATPSTHPNPASKIWPNAHENMLKSHAYQLEQHSNAILNHKGFIEEGTANIIKHDERLESIEKALKENNEKMNRSRAVFNGVLWTLAAATVATTGTSLYLQHSSSGTMAHMANLIQEQQREINRIKALSGQQGGAMQGQGVAGTTGRGTYDGGLV